MKNWIPAGVYPRLRSGVVMTIIGTLFITGCATAPRTVFYQLNAADKVDQKTLDRLLWENALDPNQNMSNSVILTSDMASYHLVQVRTQEEPHKHEYHDSVAFVQSGTGVMFLKDQPFKVGPGAVIFIEHGTPHYFVNTGPEPAVIIAVFSPPYDGKDRIPVTPKKVSGDR